ncbi:ABC transporter permease [Thermaerobacter sp. PB12/4term]|uniref:ABC transporter permease n=1 Tax=Thermaerobacter sp. PB12/4term TaxID=2293838 RepID=UPI000E32530A|nr:ABC transporter permease [Thermaerobacter sp. PB12/4term]QIA26808.1 ABC transporter permease [Thermaerobacter sp. PB12/4term]
MLRYVIKRLLLLIPTLFGISVAVFGFLYLIPGDPAQAILGERATPEMLARLREEMGLNDPFWVQYGRFAGQLLRGELGRSLRSGLPVSRDIAVRLPATIELTFAAMLVAIPLGVLAGVIAAVRRRTILDYGVMAGSMVGVSMPIFWLGLVMMYYLAVDLKWLPPSGRLSVEYEAQVPFITGMYLVDTLLVGNLPAFVDAARHLVMPALALATIPAAFIARMTRSSLLEVLRQDYVRTARAKGLLERIVTLRHALPNAMLPVLTVTGLQVGSLLGGAVLTETIFSLNGVGRYIVDSISYRDYPAVQGAVFFVATLFVLTNLVVDLLYALVDPRIRYD